MFLSNVENLSRQSHAIVKVKCQFGVVDNCVNIKELQYRDALNNIERNHGKYICMYCSRHLKYSGSNNPNCSYDYDRDMLSIIDTEAKAYLLGWIASDGTVSPSSWSMTIAIDKNDLECLENIRDIVCETIAIKHKANSDLVYFDINSKKMCQDVCTYLGITRGRKCDSVQFPNLANDDLLWSFIRGYFDGDGSIRDYDTSSTPECSISSNSSDMLSSISKFANIPSKQSGNNLSFYGTNCIDFLGRMYHNSQPKYRLRRKYDLFTDWSDWRCFIRAPGMSTRLPHCYVFKTDKNAIIPSRAKMSDVGYDLTIIKKEKEWYNNITLYDTGIKISMAHGYYAEVVPRSSLSKSGYILANSVGIIDPNYKGNIFIALVKIDPTAPDIQLPFRCCQLIFKAVINVDMIEVVDDFNETTRGDGGFGSTGY